MKLSQDSLATILLCTDLGLNKADMQEYKPYTLSQWNRLADKILNSKLGKPSALLNAGRDTIAQELELDADEINRILNLLSRGGSLAILLEQLENRGIQVTTRAEENYPAKLKKVLKKYSPAVLYFSGDISLADKDAVAVVGSRDVDNNGLEFTKILARKAAEEGLVIVSGGAKGVDSIAETAALDEGGKVISVVSDSMTKRIKMKPVREAIMRGDLLVLSAVDPDTRFSVYSAMDRNKYIYGLSNYSVAVAATENKGGTWTGAVENQKRGWTPLFVKDGEGVPKGNKKLIELGGKPLSFELLNDKNLRLIDWFTADHKEESKKEDYQQISLDMLSFAKPDETSGVKNSESGINNETYDPSKESSSRKADAKDLDVYPLILDYLKEALQEPLNQEQLSDKLKVNKAQVSQWLGRAVEDGTGERRSKPTVYVLKKGE